MTTYTASVSSAGATTGHWGDIALVFSGATGIGATANTTGTGAAQVGITTTADHSSVAVLVLDWNGVSGASRTWLTVNGVTPTAGNGDELDYTLDSTNYASYVAYYPDAGLKGTVTVGLSAPTGMKFTILAVEITGTGVTTSGGLALNPLGMSGAGAVTRTGGLALAQMALAGTAAVSVPPAFPQVPLGITVEILINGTWIDITSFVYARSDITITRGRPDETQQVTPAQCTLTLNNRDGRFSPAGTGAYAPYFGRNVQLRVSVQTWFEWPVTTYTDTYPGAYTDLYGAAVTSTTGGQYSGYRFWGEIAQVTQHVDESGNDIYCEVTAAGPLRRYSQGSSTIGSALRRYYSRLTGSLAPYAYWPCEDSSGVTQIASWVSGVPAMGFTGSPQFGSDSSFGGSDAIPQVNASAWHGQTAAAASPPGAGSLTENVPGTYTWTCPPGVTQVTGVLCTGGGGGGGGFGATKGGGGGGGGGTGAAASAAVTPGVTYTYTVGAGGVAAPGPATQGGAGGQSQVTWDSVTVTGPAGQGGLPGDTSAGGAGGAAATGGHAGGAGGAGTASTTTTTALVLRAPAGGSGTANGGTAGQVSYDWTAPAGVTSALITAAAGGGGGAGGAAGGAGAGGGGGGGAGFASGTIFVTAGSSYTMKAGYGGAGGASGKNGQSGGTSSASGDSGSTVTASGGQSGSTAGGGGGHVTPSGTAGSPGGAPGAKTGAIMGAGGGGGGGGGGNGTGHAGSGRTPGAGGGDGSEGGWGASFSGYPNATPGTTGKTSTSAASGGGGGGGALTNTTGKSGGGGGGGYIVWQWAQSGVPSGGGGGGSAGTSSAGNTGGSNGSGAAAVTGGGAGGAQGSPGSVPGGGGGGGVPDTGNQSGGTTAPAAGAPGQVSFSWTGGAVSPVPADIVSFALDVAPTGGTWPSYSFTATSANPCVFTLTGASYANGTPVRLSGAGIPTGFNNSTTYYVVATSGGRPSTSTFELALKAGGAGIASSSTGSGNVAEYGPWVVARALTYGTVATLDVQYSTGGNIALAGYDATGNQLFYSGPVAFGVDGVPVYVTVQLTAAGTGATWEIAAIQPGAATSYQLTGTVPNVTVGYVSDVYVSPNADVDFASVGHVAVQTAADPLTALSQAIAGYAGETAAARMARLCAEEGLSFTLAAGGTPADTPQMGAQQDDTFTNVMQSCEDIDQGHLCDDRDSFGLTYRTRVSLQGQDPAVTLDWSAGMLARAIQPVTDDQWTRNDIQLTVGTTARGGATNPGYILKQTTGPMSVSQPPNGVGDYTYSLTAYVYSASQLANLAAWILTVGTVPDSRFPVLPLDLTRTETAALAVTIATLDSGDFIQITNAPTWVASAPIAQLMWGVTETMNAFKWSLDVNAVPESPYSEGNPPTW